MTVPLSAILQSAYSHPEHRAPCRARGRSPLARRFAGGDTGRYVGRLAGSAIAGAGLLAARQYYRNWGTTKDECQMALPGDEFVEQPAVQTTEGVWIEAPAAEVWPWLVQMGQDRGGLYSYENWRT